MYHCSFLFIFCTASFRNDWPDAVYTHTGPHPLPPLPSFLYSLGLSFVFSINQRAIRGLWFDPCSSRPHVKISLGMIMTPERITCGNKCSSFTAYLSVICERVGLNSSCHLWLMGEKNKERRLCCDHICAVMNSAWSCSDLPIKTLLISSHHRIVMLVSLCPQESEGEDTDESSCSERQTALMLKNK